MALKTIDLFMVLITTIDIGWKMKFCVYIHYSFVTWLLLRIFQMANECNNKWYTNNTETFISITFELMPSSANLYCLLCVCVHKICTIYNIFVISDHFIRQYNFWCRTHRKSNKKTLYLFNFTGIHKAITIC